MVEHEFDKGLLGAALATGASPHGGRLGKAVRRTRISPCETSGLVPGTALDAGCGVGTEAIWLASHGWQVTAADNRTRSPRPRPPRRRERTARWPRRVRWVEADPDRSGTRAGGFDLVPRRTTRNPAMPQLAFYDRIFRLGGARRHPADRRARAHPRKATGPGHHARSPRHR